MTGEKEDLETLLEPQDAIKHNDDQEEEVVEAEQNTIDAEIENEFTVDAEKSDCDDSKDDNQKMDDNSNKAKNSGFKADKKKAAKKQVKKRRQSFNLNGLQHDHMEQYNGLKDEFLQGFFCNEKRKYHLIKMGMVTKDGYVVNKPEEYLRKKALYNKLYGLENKQKKGKRSKTFNKKPKNPYSNEVDVKVDKTLKESKKVNIEPKRA